MQHNRSDNDLCICFIFGVKLSKIHSICFSDSTHMRQWFFRLRDIFHQSMLQTDTIDATDNGK